MRKRLLAGVLAAWLVPAALASAGDPIMPLGDVRPGMQCTGYSVIRGTEPAAFDVEVIDVVGGEHNPELLVEVSGEAVEDSGIGAGFSGSPVYCPGSDGVMRNAGAIAATIGDYGGRTVLATPIESVLAADPRPAGAGAGAGGTSPGGSASGSGRRLLATPLTVSGLAPSVMAALRRRALAQGRTIVTAAPVPVAGGAGPAGSPASAGLRPGSAVSIGLSSGDVGVGAIGTVAYVDGPDVWTLGHAFDAVGVRNLFLQHAYVATVVSNPVQFEHFGGSYKFAGPTSDIGTVTDDTFASVAGRVGGLPASTPVRVYAHDLGDGRTSTSTTLVADESSVGTPAGISGLSFVAPLAVAQAATSPFRSIPTRMQGTMCLQVVLRERRKPIRFCNRYVSDGTGTSNTYGNIVAVSASQDMAEVLALIDEYKPADLEVAEVSARLRMERGQHQAFIRSVRLPRRARPGERITGRLRIQRVRGERRTVSFSMRAPRRPGRRRVVVRGRDADSAEDALFETLIIEVGGGPRDSTGPKNLRALVREMRRVKRYDGVRTKDGQRVYRSGELRIGGRAETTVRITRRRG